MYGDIDMLFAWAWGVTVGFFVMLAVVAVAMRRR